MVRTHSGASNAVFLQSRQITRQSVGEREKRLWTTIDPALLDSVGLFVFNRYQDRPVLDLPDGIESLISFVARTVPGHVASTGESDPAPCPHVALGLSITPNRSTAMTSSSVKLKSA